MRLCSIEGCGRKHYANGHCNKHWAQIRKYGKILERTKFDPNEIIIENNICRMKLYNPNNEEIAETIFDLEYKYIIDQYKWNIGNHGYVQSDYSDTSGKKRRMLLHQVVIYLSGRNVENNEEIDHKDNNKLNNMLLNLRVCSHIQNSQNKKLQKNNTLGSKGIFWHKRDKKWYARIGVNGITIHLGGFLIKEDAARAYNTAAIKYFGEFAKLNEV